MRLRSFAFAALGALLLGLASQPAAASPVNAKVITQLSPTAVRPQARAITSAICSTVTISATVTVLFIRVPITLANVCLCATSDGEITVDSTTQLTNLVSAQLKAAGVNLNLLGVLNLSTLITNTFIPLAKAALGAKTTTCIYPSFAIPDSCTSCNYQCKTGYTICNRQCVPLGQPCVSPGLQKRSLATRSKFICPLDKAPCPASRGTTKVNALFDIKNVECVDIRRKLESCGGCMTPFRGQAQGQDCSQLPNVVDVACVDGGCVVGACERGFVPNADASACVEPSVLASQQAVLLAPPPLNATTSAAGRPPVHTKPAALPRRPVATAHVLRETPVRAAS